MTASLSEIQSLLGKDAESLLTHKAKVSRDLLALFREGGALRVIAAGQEPDTFDVESVAQAPPGFPQPLIKPYPLSTDDASGVLRQTATGWSDEEHELNNALGVPGDFKKYDMVYQPDPISAIRRSGVK